MTVFQGEIIEEYPSDRPYPSCLIYGKTFRDDPVHSVWAYNQENHWAVPNYCISSRSKTLDQLANKEAKRCCHLISAPCAVAKWSKKRLRNFCVVESTLRY
ncbi:MAG: DUF4258 domain-containing protein [Deltaproteobacteria bacterium]|nr:DUF4258 domain-containing protein [Deltaproteobacteria bacterium]MDL1989114.1 DUF4258 domain-containing protein [Deltaproteobacteria bacterium]